MTQIALEVALLALSSYWVVPLPFTPIVLSLHTVMVNLIALTLNARQAAWAVGVYLLLGALGAPILAAGSGGLDKLLGPTGGFYFGFWLAAVLMASLKGDKPNWKRYALVTIGVGIPLQHLCAVLMMAFYNGGHFQAAFWVVSLPFLPGDILKALGAYTLGAAINKALSWQRDKNFYRGRTALS